MKETYLVEVIQKPKVVVNYVSCLGKEQAKGVQKTIMKTLDTNKYYTKISKYDELKRYEQPLS